MTDARILRLWTLAGLVALAAFGAIIAAAAWLS